MYVGQEKQTLVYIYAECSSQPHRHANTIYYMPTPATSNNVMIFIAKSRPRINIRHRRHHFKSTALILLDGLVLVLEIKREIYICSFLGLYSLSMYVCTHVYGYVVVNGSCLL